MRKTKSLSVNVTANLVNQVGAALFPLITFPYVSRILKPEGLGRVNFAQATLSYFLILATLGIPRYGVRESAKRRDDKIALSTLAAELFSLNAIMTAIALAVFGAFALVSQPVRSDPALFWICALPMLLTPIGFNWLFGGLEEYVYITLRTLVFRVLVLVAIFLFVHTQEDVRVYALIAALNTAGASLLNLVFVRKHVSMRSVDRARMNVRRHIKPALVMFSLGGVVSIYTSLNKVMLGYLTNDAEVGLYSAADRVVKVLVMLVTSVGIVLLPRAAYYVKFAKRAEYRRLTTVSLQFILFMSFPAAAGLIVSADSLIPLLSGQAFRPAVPLVKIMALDIVWIALGNFVGYQVLYSHGKEKLLLYSVVCGAVCNLVLNWFLIPRWHAVGAACSTLIAETCVTTARLILSRAYSDFTWPILSLLKYAATAIVMGGVALVVHSFLIESAVGPGLRLLIPAAVAAVFYVTVLWLLRDSMVSAIWNRLTAGLAAVGKAFGAGICL